MSEQRSPVSDWLSADHRRVVSVRLRKLAAYCASLVDLLEPEPSIALPQTSGARGDAEEARRLLAALQEHIARVQAELGLPAARRDRAREATALLATMMISTEELQPEHLKGYGQVPKNLECYLETKTREFAGLVEEIARRLGKPVRTAELKS
jgi:predicted RNA-binding Zn ribbon-like protein